MFACAFIAAGSSISAPCCSPLGTPLALIWLPPVLLFVPSMTACIRSSCSLCLSDIWDLGVSERSPESSSVVMQCASLSGFPVREEPPVLWGWLVRLLAADLGL